MESVIIVTSASDLPLHTIKCYSVVFGVTLRLLVINTWSSSPTINKLCCLPATSVIHLPRSLTAECVALGSRTVQSMRWSQILAENGNFCLPHLHSMPQLGGPHWHIAIMTATEKLEWYGNLMVKNFEDMFIRFDRVHERDRRISQDDIGHACIASHGQNWEKMSKKNLYQHVTLQITSTST